MSETKTPIQPFSDRESTFDLFARHVSPGKVKTYRDYGFDVVMGAREGAVFFDAFDPSRRFYNCHCNGGVFNLGHRNPRVLSALSSALETLDIGNHHLVSGYRAELARRLCATTDDQLPGVIFGVSGGEAIDLAIKLARGFTKRRNIISIEGGYHGHTGLSVAAGDVQYREPFFASLPDFCQVPFDNTKALEAALNDQVAAVLLEPIPATLGMPIPEGDYLRRVSGLCEAHGALLIVDEVQTGLGRTGAMWCYQHDEISPDIVVIGKGLGGGLFPITATLVSESILAFSAQHPFAHISTFGGAELGCAVALSVLDIVQEQGFMQRVETLGRQFEQAFLGAPFLLHRRGMFMGLKFPAEQMALAAMKMLFDAGIFVVYANNDRRVLQFLPPLIIKDEEAAEIAGMVRRVLG